MSDPVVSPTHYDPVYRDPNLRIVFAVTLMAVLGVSSVTPTFPAMQQALGITPQDTGLLITMFTLPGVVATLPLGILADRVGRKWVLVPSLALFAIAGIAVPLASTFEVMLAFRLLQGFGAAGLGSLNATIICDLYRGRRMTAALGYNAAVLSIGTAAYPAIGGAVATFGWRYPFYLPLLALPVAWLVWFRLQSSETLSEQSLRGYLASALVAVSNWHIVGLFVAGLSAFVLLYGAYTTYLPFLLAQSFAASPAAIGIVMSSMSVSTGLVASQLSRLTRHFAQERLITASFLFYALALAAIPAVNSLWLILVPAVFYGLGHGMNSPSIQAVLGRLAPPQQRGAFMSLNGMVLRLGQTIGPLLMGAAYTSWGTNGVYRLGAALAILTAVVVAALLGSGRRAP